MCFAGTSGRSIAFPSVILLPFVSLSNAFVTLATGEVDAPVCALAGLSDGLGFADEGSEQVEKMTDGVLSIATC